MKIPHQHRIPRPRRYPLRPLEPASRDVGGGAVAGDLGRLPIDYHLTADGSLVVVYEFGR